MDQRERANPYEDALLAAMDGLQKGLWTACPGIIQSYDGDAITCVVQPAIKGSQLAEDGTSAPVNMPLLLDCPVHFPGGGGATLTFPIAQGDECLVVFASRCIDAWWQSGGIQPQAEFRMHDLSDGFVLPKVWSQAKVLTNVSTTTTQLRSDDGATVIELDAAGQKLNLTAPGGTKVIGTLEVTGAITADGTITASGTIASTGGDIVANGISLMHHVHPGVQAGAATTQPPTG